MLDHWVFHGACRPAAALEHPNRRPAKPTVDTHRTEHDPWNESLEDWEPAENDPNLRFVREQYEQLQYDLQFQQQHQPPPHQQQHQPPPHQQQHRPPPHHRQQHQPPQQPQQQADRAEPEPLQPVLLPADVTMRALAGLLGARKAQGLQ